MLSSLGAGVPGKDWRNRVRPKRRWRELLLEQDRSEEKSAPCIQLAAMARRAQEIGV